MENKNWQIELEKSFNDKFGFGTWDSRATNQETLLRTHRNEGINSSDVLEFFRKFCIDLMEEKQAELTSFKNSVMKKWTSLKIPNDLPKDLDKELCEFTVFLQGLLTTN